MALFIGSPPAINIPLDDAARINKSATAMTRKLNLEEPLDPCEAGILTQIGQTWRRAARPGSALVLSQYAGVEPDFKKATSMPIVSGDNNTVYAGADHDVIYIEGNCFEDHWSGVDPDEAGSFYHQSTFNTYTYSGGFNNVFGEDGNDTVYAYCGANTIDAGSGNDVIRIPKSYQIWFRSISFCLHTGDLSI